MSDQDQTHQDRQACDAAADAAVRAVAISYLAETTGRPLNRQQRDLRQRAERLARHLDRTQRKDRP
jgi:hypothetical protein